MKHADEFARRLNMVMKGKGLRSPAELADLTGMNRITLGSYMRGERAASLEACVNLARHLGVSAIWLHSGKEGSDVDSVSRGVGRSGDKKTVAKTHQTDSPNAVAVPGNYTQPWSTVQIPLYSSALAGPDGAVTIGETVEMTEAPTVLSSVRDSYAVRVSGESMEPRYFAGEVVYVHPTMPVRRGDFVIAQIAEDGTEGVIQGYVKQFVSIDDRHLVLEQLNPAKQMRIPRSRVKSVHRIVLAG